MKLTFLGTRGNIDARNRRHRRHAAALVEYCGTGIVDSDERRTGTASRRWPACVPMAPPRARRPVPGA